MSVLMRRLCLSALLVLATGLFAQESTDQSLGDVARHARSERAQSRARRKVYTNDDFTNPDSGDGSETAGANDQNSKTASSGAAASEASAKDEAKKEDELKKRTDEVNKQYTDKLDDIRKQIAAAKQDLERLQRDQVESANQLRTANSGSPTASEYQEQQRQLQQQMEEDRRQIATLNSQLEDAQEAARHAGVRTGE